MKRLIITLVLILIATGSIAGQALEIDSNAQEAIKKLSFMIGEWEGDGWMMGRDGQKHTFNQTEKVQFKLDDTAILIEGMGRSNEEVIHNAMAVLIYNQSEGNFSFNSYLSTGMQGTFNAELIEDSFYWYPNENMRYIIRLNEEDQWFEVGEIKRGDSWFQFFEMTLNRS